MSRSTRRRGAGLVAVALAVACATVASGTPLPAGAPNWPTSGYHPTCASSGANGTKLHKVDTAVPTMSLKVTRIIRLGNAVVKPTWGTLRAKQPCSGVDTMRVTIYRASTGSSGTFTFSPGTTTTNGQFFDVTGRMTVAAATPFTLGKWTYVNVSASRRWSSFDLSADQKSVSDIVVASAGSPPASAYTASSSAYRAVATYVLRDTRLSLAKNRRSLRKGRSITVSGTLQVSTGLGEAGVAKASILLQRRYPGSKKWVTVKRGRTNGKGHIALTTKPSRSLYYRLVYSGRYGAPYNAPRTTATTRKVTVKK